jgi:hypothetical protein
MKSTFVLTLLILAVNLAHSQESKKYLKLKQKINYREGYILDKDSIKVKGLVKDYFVSELKIYSVVTFVHLDGTREKYKPNEIKGFGYAIYKFESDDSSFYKVIREGKKVSLYQKLHVTGFSTPEMPGIPSVSNYSKNEDYYLKKHNETTFNIVNKKNFASEYSTYFGDCEEVANKILSKQYTIENIKRIVVKYNYCD